MDNFNELLTWDEIAQKYVSAPVKRECYLLDDLYDNIKGRLDVVINNHNELNNLDFAHAGHTGFASTADLNQSVDALTTEIGAVNEEWQTQLEAEREARRESYDLLYATDVAEKAERIAADDRLSADILAEGAARAEGDIELSGKIDELSDEIEELKGSVDGFETEIGLAKDNILINSDFRSVVNQRGETSYTVGGGAIYTIDGWSIGGGAPCTLTVSTDYITLTKTSDTTSVPCRISQIVENYKYFINKNVTLTIKYKTSSDTAPYNILFGYGGPSVTEFLPQSTTWRTYSFNTTVPQDATTLGIYIRISNTALINDGIDIEWITLCEGTIPCTTPYVDPSIKLANTQRRLQRLRGNITCSAYIVNTSIIRFVFNTNVPMRIKPALSIQNNALSVRLGVNVENGFTFSVVDYQNGYIAIDATKALHAITNTLGINLVVTTNDLVLLESNL